MIACSYRNLFCSYKCSSLVDSMQTDYGAVGTGGHGARSASGELASHVKRVNQAMRRNSLRFSPRKNLTPVCRLHCIDA